MGLYLRNADVRRLETALDTCLAPLAYESADEWRAAVERDVQELLQGDHVVFAIPLDGSVDVHATNVAPTAVEAMAHLFARVPDIPADPFLNAIEAERVEHGVEVWSRVGAYLQAVRGGRLARQCAFLGEVLAPSAMRDSENIDFSLPIGHTALCVSFEDGDGRRRGGAGSARTAARSLLRMLLPSLKAGVGAVVRHRAQRAELAGPTMPDDSLPTAALRARWGLTAREAEITLLLARRATNPEIAAGLGLSPHTVRHHIERVFLKLDVRSRREIARRLSTLA